MSPLAWVGLAFGGMCLAVVLGWALMTGNRTDPRLVDLDEEW